MHQVEEKTKPTMIFQYIKENGTKGRKIGVMVATLKDDDYVIVGWSKCFMKKDDFARPFGLRIARGRAEKGSNCTIPNTILKNLVYFAARASRYFKTSNVQVAGIVDIETKDKLDRAINIIGKYKQYFIFSHI